MESGTGLKLSRSFFVHCVEPLLARQFPDLSYTAARIGRGSEVLGYDTEASADHDYGPSLQIFLPTADFPQLAPAIMQVLDSQLPGSFQGWPVRFSASTRPANHPGHPGVLWSGHGVELYTLEVWCDRYLQRRYTRPPTWRQWLSEPEYQFLLVTAGLVFRDDIGELGALRDRLSYFPEDVWLYKLAAQWARIAEERAYIGRTGEVSDEIGSCVIAARMVENMMRLALMIERQYAPYAKWLGTAFANLACAAALSPILERALSASAWQDREIAIYDGCHLLAALQMDKKIPGAILPADGRLHLRQYKFVDSLRISASLKAAIRDEELRSLEEFGGADQFISSNFIKSAPQFTRAAFNAIADKQLG